MIDSLLGQRPLSRDAQDYLDVLSDLVERYEEEHHPMPALSDSAMLRQLIEVRGIRQIELARATGIANSTISAVLNGSRKLNRRHIGALAEYFHVDPGVFTFDEEEPRKGKLLGAKKS
jgi:HTH-type transcriptional regulator/antitoxin HigA